MIAKRIKELRKLTGISQQKLATDLGLTQASVGNWENGTRYPKTETLKAIANYFDVSIDYLLGTSTDALLTLSHKVPLHIKELRTKHGITAKQLGEIIGVAESTISLYETGKRYPNYSTLMKIADHFNVTVDYILGRDSIIPDANSRTAPQFSTLLKELRTAQGKKQREIAEQLGIDRTTYGKYETGVSEPDFKITLKIADYFNVSVDYLLGRKKSPQDESVITPSPFPDNLKKLRTARQLTQTALAEQLGVSRSTVAMWESGESEPNIETILFLCQLLNTTPSALLDVDNTPANLTATDQKLLDAYHAADPDIRFAVDLILKKHGK